MSVEDVRRRRGEAAGGAGKSLPCTCLVSSSNSLHVLRTTDSPDSALSSLTEVLPDDDHPKPVQVCAVKLYCHFCKLSCIAFN